MKDQYGRKIEYARISVTDRCSLRCRYCMPAEGVQPMQHADILSYEELLRIAAALARLGVQKVRVTGGEPLVRRGIVDFVRELKVLPGIRKVVLTTNGVALPELAEPLVAAGLDGVNMSLDTLDAAEFASITRCDRLAEVREGLFRLLDCGCPEVKLNVVPIAGVNEDSLLSLAALAKEYPLSVRFIELMPIGCAAASGYRGIPSASVRSMLEQTYGAMVPQLPPQEIHGPAVYYALPGFRGRLGFIDALEHKFCSSCNRVRVTASGFLKLCLNSSAGIDLRSLLRGGADDDTLYGEMQRAIYRKPVEHFFYKPDNKMKDTRKMYEVGG